MERKDLILPGHDHDWSRVTSAIAEVVQEFVGAPKCVARWSVRGNDCSQSVSQTGAVWSRADLAHDLFDAPTGNRIATSQIGHGFTLEYVRECVVTAVEASIGSMIEELNPDLDFNNLDNDTTDFVIWEAKAVIEDAESSSIGEVLDARGGA